MSERRRKLRELIERSVESELDSLEIEMIVDAVMRRDVVVAS